MTKETVHDLGEGHITTTSGTYPTTETTVERVAPTDELTFDPDTNTLSIPVADGQSK